MIKAIYSSNIDGRNFTVGNIYHLLSETIRVEKISLVRHLGAGHSVSEVFVVTFDNGYKLSVPFKNYEYLYKE